MQHKLRMEPDQVVEAAVRAVKLARQFTDDVEFSAEDAFRSEEADLMQVYQLARENEMLQTRLSRLDTGAATGLTVSTAAAAPAATIRINGTRIFFIGPLND